MAVTQGNAKVNEEFVLTYSLKALMDLPETKVLFEIHEGIELIDGDPSQIIYPYFDDSIPVSLELKILQSGPYRITVHTVIAPGTDFAL